MKKLNNRGFSAIETVTILAIVAIVVGVGWFVINSKNEANDTNDSVSNTQSDTNSILEKKSTDGLTEVTLRSSLIKILVPDSQNPIKECEDSNKSEDCIKTKDYTITADPSANFVYNASILYTVKCNYKKSTNTFTYDKKNVEGTADSCKFQKSTINGISFYDIPLAYESLGSFTYITPVINDTIITVSASYTNKCYGNENISDKECEAASDALKTKLGEFVEQITENNKDLFK